MSQSSVHSYQDDPVRQFSIFTENKVGRLYDIIAVFHRNNIHAIALTMLDTTDTTILRMVVDDPEKARQVLNDLDQPFSECILLAVEIQTPQEVTQILATMLEVEVNIHYMYAFIVRPHEKSALALHVEDIDIAAHALTCKGFRVLGQRDISR